MIDPLAPMRRCEFGSSTGVPRCMGARLPFRLYRAVVMPVICVGEFISSNARQHIPERAFPWLSLDSSTGGVRLAHGIAVHRVLRTLQATVAEAHGNLLILSDSHP